MPLVTVVDAFTCTAGCGNRAGVVFAGVPMAPDVPNGIPESPSLTSEDMQAVAHRVGVSETAFVTMLDCTSGVVALRYFTPQREVAFCGHATVAAFHVVWTTSPTLARDAWTLSSGAGRFDVTIEPDTTSACPPRIWTATPLPPAVPTPIDAEEILTLLGAAPEALDHSIPLWRAGHRLYVPIRTRPDLWRLAPRFDAIASAGAPYGVLGIFAFTRDTIEARSATHARYFAPAQGVPEDPVTGAAHGPLAAHLCAAGYLPLAPEQDVLVLQGEQGDVLGRPGRVAMRVRRTGHTIPEVLIGGTAVTIGTHQVDPGRV